MQYDKYKATIPPDIKNPSQGQLGTQSTRYNDMLYLNSR